MSFQMKINLWLTIEALWQHNTAWLGLAWLGLAWLGLELPGKE
jgi:hypothetical protein